MRPTRLATTLLLTLWPLAAFAESPATAPPPSAPAAVAPASAAPAPAAVREVRLAQVATVPMGRWPESVLVRGDTAYVADSGERRVMAVDLKTLGAGAVPTAKALQAGRLPTHLALTSDATLWVLAQTENRLYRLPPNGRALAALPALADCPNDLAAGDDVLYSLLWQACSSADSRVARTDPKTGKARLSALLGRNAWALSAAGGRVVVAQEERLSVLDATTLAVLSQPAVPGRHMHVQATATAWFVDDDRRVLRVDAATGQVTHTLSLDARVTRLVLAAGGLYAAQADGRIAELDLDALTVRRRLVPEIGPFEPTDVALSGDFVLVTSYRTQPAEKNPDGDGGRLLIFRLAEPGAAAPR